MSIRNSIFHSPNYLAMGIVLWLMLAISRSEAGCNRTFELFGRTYPVRTLPAESSGLSVPNLFGDTDQIFIGFKVHGHAYLYAGGYMVEGEALSHTGKIKRNTNIVDADGLIHFPNLSSRTKNDVFRFLESRKKRRGLWSLHCLHTACRPLRAAGNIRIPGWAHLLSTRLLRDILEKRPRDKHGRPLDIDIYTSPEVSFSDIYEGFVDTEAAYREYWLYRLKRFGRDAPPGID